MTPLVITNIGARPAAAHKTPAVRSHKESFCLLKQGVSLVAKPDAVTTYILGGDDLGWGAPGLDDDLGWGGEATRDAQGCGGGPPPLGLLERDINYELVNTS